MALAAQIVYTVIDDSGDRGTTSVSVPNSFSLSQFGEFASSMATLVDALLSGKLESAEICFGVDISGLSANLETLNSDVEAIGAFQFRTSEGLPVTLNVPALQETLVTAGSDDIDQADLDVAALIAAMEDGLATSGGTISPCDVGEVDIVNTDYARERFRASGKAS